MNDTFEESKVYDDIPKDHNTMTAANLTLESSSDLFNTTCKRMGKSFFDTSNDEDKSIEGKPVVKVVDDDDNDFILLVDFILFDDFFLDLVLFLLLLLPLLLLAEVEDEKRNEEGGAE